MLKQKLTTALGVIVIIAISGWGITYVPVLSDMVPSLFAAPMSTIHIDRTDFTLGDVEAGTMPDGMVQDGCKKIPFLLRPLASKPLKTRVILTADGQEFGEIIYDCRTGDVLDQTEY